VRPPFVKRCILFVAQSFYVRKGFAGRAALRFWVSVSPWARKGLEGTCGSLCEPLVSLRCAQRPEPRKARSYIFLPLAKKCKMRPMKKEKYETGEMPHAKFFLE
jgi:hypothetical protein